MEWTREKIEALPAAKRETLFDNARAKNTPEGQQIIALMVEHDLLVREGGGLPREHPTIQKIEEIIRSDEGRAGGKKASDEGQPAMAGVDHMLSKALGSRYGNHDTTSWAGTFMADVMADAGYVQTRKKPMPEGCVAKTAAFFERR
ncbi:hypothetical protein [Sphingomonas psychrolutea]|uniref:Uncharacterized protein n=1 Tax=Sphingomonas psychrolutea TaxID=1259676 RepID=A0ABQ1GWP5_9SPHN|nr:hypothetical protein [Sphingomonas psychrolutea]GGA51519.1 hypothetical protein GCM10011395_22370 [Sphingomonas psychrolutea]